MNASAVVSTSLYKLWLCLLHTLPNLFLQLFSGDGTSSVAGLYSGVSAKGVGNDNHTRFAGAWLWYCAVDSYVLQMQQHQSLEDVFRQQNAIQLKCLADVLGFSHYIITLSQANNPFNCSFFFKNICCYILHKKKETQASTVQQRMLLCSLSELVCVAVLTVLIQGAGLLCFSFGPCTMMSARVQMAVIEKVFTVAQSLNQRSRGGIRG